MYSKIRRFDTDIHIYEFEPAEVTFVLCAEDKRSPLSQINHNYWENHGKVCYAKVNAGFFGWSLDTNTSGVDYRDEGFTFSDTTANDEFIELVYSGRRLHHFDGTVAEVRAKYPHAEWAVSLGYTLVEGGKKSIRKAWKFSHSYVKNPRTMIGQKLNGRIILAVTDDRGTGSAGLTADEQASVMLELGCDMAINADGGGSSEMIVDGEIKNNVGTDGERAIATAFMVYGEPKEEEVKPMFPVVTGKVKIAPNFTLDEIACRHCGEVELPDYRLMIVAQGVRDHFGKPIRLVGTRCKTHNKAIGGDPNSLHMQSKALDISAWNNDIDPKVIYDYILSAFDFVKRAKLYPDSHVHIQTTWMT